MPITIKNIVLDRENLSLVADEVTTAFDGRKIIETATKKITFYLRETDPTEIANKRKTNIPYFVLKIDGKLYLSKIKRNLRVVGCSILDKHVCVNGTSICKRLSAAPEEAGGCAKIREGSTGIERYSWITTGYETFNTSHDSFVVVACSKYECCPPKPAVKLSEINAAKLGLAHFVWDDIDSLAQVRARTKRNLKYGNNISL